jgi:hypothetical protein
VVEQVVGDGTIVALEGNYHDQITRVRRSMQFIEGFAHLPFESTPTPQPVPQDDQGEEGMRLIWHKGAIYAVDVAGHSPWGLQPVAVDALTATGLKVGGKPEDDQSDLLSQLGHEG